MKLTMAVLSSMMMLACGTTPKPDLQAILAPAGEYPDGVVYQRGSEAEWQRAQLWVARHSGLKIQIATDVLIQTYKPRRYDLSYAYAVTREPIGGDAYVIRMQPYCGLSIGCEPDPDGVKRGFYHYVATGDDVFANVDYNGLQ